ncbi:MAG: feruloyl-CoA synthase [Betaproteobacteria bacterium RIFCSPLOWO2_12_FULL_68_19]|nr:MAG: feruloyl-CoA synthase [Betaproteobacteria bacterium RIFCSPLOWO2_12_FULL_68_19]
MRPHMSLRYAPAEVHVEKRAGGVMVLRSPQALKPYARAVGDWLVHWHESAPDRSFLAERKGDAWRRVTYRDALSDARRIGQALLNLGLDATRPVAILSDNSVDHALLALGAMHVGIPVAPISPAYSLMSKDFAKLKYIFELIRPGLVFAADPEKFAPALAAVGATSTPVAQLLETNPGSTLEVAFSRLTPDSVAKILFTSGSTGTPKGVINTHRMLCANQQMLAQGWPFVEERPPVIVDWLPWNHTFGGNHNFNMVLRNGGTLYIDGGKPAPGLIETTARNLGEVSPTIYFNVPRGFDLLLPFLEADEKLRRNFFRELDVVFYAAAALPQSLWKRIEKLAQAEKPGGLAMLSAWGSTETSPLAAQVHFPIERAGVIGLPVAGCELKLVPAAGKLEVRVRGPNVTRGYFRRDDLTKAAFDEEGFYRIGDAMKFSDPAVPGKGLEFDGRVAEDFKLTTGTWVHVGAVRVKLIAAGDPLIQDAVITGHDRDETGALVFLNPAVAKDLSAGQIREKIASALKALAGEGGSSMHPVRALVMAEPPSIDANEITDKGYINQRAVLERRAALVEKLHADPAPPEVIR